MNLFICVELFTAVVYGWANYSASFSHMNWCSHMMAHSLLWVCDLYSAEVITDVAMYLAIIKHQ